jgi:site-specific DNA-methyltransferase (adenine-specific)
MIQNKVIFGDCFNVLNKIKSESVDLIYLDPPFFTQREHKLTTRDGRQNYNFSDKWKDIDTYIECLTTRLNKCRDVLKNTGSLFLHCDRIAAHYLKVTLDSIFGVENFQSEIIWSYKRWSNSKKGLLNNHQTIFFYSKSENFKFNQCYEDYSPATNIDQIVQLRKRDERNKTVYQKNEDGTPVLCTEKRGVPSGDVWDIPYLNPKAKERVNYPTQKPIILLEKIIRLVTDVGDLVLDPYCGSGTSLVSAKLLGRKYYGIDNNKEAIKLARKRLAQPMKSESNLLKKGRSSYDRKDLQIREVVANLKAILVQRNKGIDALISLRGQIVPIKIVLNKKDLIPSVIQLIRSSQKNGYKSKAIHVVFNFSESQKAEVYSKYGVIAFDAIKELDFTINHT